MNTANYYLTEEGVISKLDTYWDKLRDITHEMEVLSKNMLKTLFGSFSISLFLVAIIFWLNIDHKISLILLSFTALASFSAAMLQLATYFELRTVRKRGMILYNELNREFENNYADFFDDMPVEEKIILNHFLLACELPISHHIYLSLLILMPLLNIFFFVFHYWLIR